MFLNADVVVQVSLIGRAFASMVTRTGWLAKSLELMITRGLRSGLGTMLQLPLARRGGARVT